MGIVLEVIEGPGLGAQYDISVGNTLGGGGCDHVLKDPLISLPALRVEKDLKGKLQVINISKEKLLSLNNKKVHRVVLMHGVKFRVGGTLFKVSSTKDGVQNSQKKPWATILYDNLHAYIFSTSRNDHFGAFNPPLQVNILEGNLAGTEFILGFGPREFGYNCFDFDINEPHLPDRAFSLVPGQKPIIRALGEESIYLNNELITESALTDQDEIRVGSLKIKITFMENI